MQTSQLHPVQERSQEEPSVSTATETKKPLVQIDNLIREMTDEELAAYEAEQANASPLPNTASNPS